jgi:mannose-6-phosphate isomerase-like protein (cupin superfamily)
MAAGCDGMGAMGKGVTRHAESPTVRATYRGENAMIARLMLACAASVLLAGAAHAQEGSRDPAAPLSARIGHYQGDKARLYQGRGNDVGSHTYDTLLGPGSLSTPLIFVHRGRINPKSGIGVQFHNRTEEMFFLFSGSAEFTINGRTSSLSAPAGVPNRLRDSNAIYNPGDTAVEFMNIAVGLTRQYDGFHTTDTRVGAPLDKEPQFINVAFDRALLRPQEKFRGGTGTAQYRRVLPPSIFGTSWSYVDHLLVPASATAGTMAEADMSEVVYVMAGAGTVTVNGQSAAIKAGDAIPVDVGQARGFAQNGAQPLELVVVGIAKDMAAKEALLARR